MRVRKLEGGNLLGDGQRIVFQNDGLSWAVLERDVDVPEFTTHA
jgi:hypothetical protein